MDIENKIMLPSKTERQHIFYWLKRVSSLTAWRRIFLQYQAWADLAERSLKEADAAGWNDKTALSEPNYVLILNGLAHCEEDVLRLSKGDKSVFKFDANGEFAMARRILFHWAELKSRIEIGENAVDERHTPLWAEFCEKLTFTCQTWQECAQQVLEPRYLDESAPTFYGDWLRKQLTKMRFPPTLSPVPDPRNNMFVRTSEMIPFSGIWEPIVVNPEKTSLVSLFRKAQEPQPPFKMAGTMNYLHGGSPAPKVTVETATDNSDIDTMWRLIWQDDRYINGCIPEEEEEKYLFQRPDSIKKKFEPLIIADEIIWCESGTPAPKGGKWLVETDKSGSITIEKGMALPLYKGQSVRWVLAVD